MIPEKPPKGVPRDEWLLALGVAEHHHRLVPDPPERWGDVVEQTYQNALVRVFPGHWIDDVGSDADAGIRGAWDVIDDSSWGDEGNPDAYAAGAALAMALEGP